MMTVGQEERMAVTMYVDFLAELEKGPKVVLTSLSEELESDFIGTLRSREDFHGFIYGVFENDESYLVTSINGADEFVYAPQCTPRIGRTYSVRFVREGLETLTFFTEQYLEKNNGQQ